MIGIIVFLIIAIIILSIVKSQLQGNEKVQKILNTGRILAGVGILLSILLACVVQIGPGEVGVQILFGKVQDGILRSGLNFINPLMEVQKLDIKTQAYTMSDANDIDVSSAETKKSDPIQTLSSDGLTLILDVTVWYRLSADDAPNILRTIGSDYESKIVLPAIRTAIRDVAVNYVATDIYSSKRNDYVNAITKRLEESFEGRGLILRKFSSEMLNFLRKSEKQLTRKLQPNKARSKWFMFFKKRNRKPKGKLLKHKV
ncbi:MAG: prohibitin family protein [Ignavibacteria bacterium]|nr:prohibitin family protein [Ignavibacteria bacterium]